MATQAIAGTTDKVLAAGLPGVLKGLGMAVYNQSPIWSKIDSNGMKKDWEGDSIQAAVMTSKYGKATSYQDDDAVNTNSVQPFTGVQFEMGGYIVSVNLTGMQIRKNQSSPEQLFNLLKTESDASIRDMIDLMSTHLFQAANDSKGILSLSTITDATTTIAGLAGSATWGGTTTTSGSFATQGKNDLMTLHSSLSVFQNQIKDAAGKTGFSGEPDLHITDRASWQRYWNSLESGMRYTPGGVGDVRLKLAFMDTPVIVDTHVVSGQWFVLNSGALKLYVHPQADFELLPDVRTTTQPDMWARACIWNGNLVFNTRRPFGKLISLVD